MRQTPSRLLAVALLTAFALPAPAGAQEAKEPQKPPAATALPPDLDDILAGQAAAAAAPIGAALARPEVQARALDLAMAQVRFPDALRGPFRAALEDLLRNAAAQAALAASVGQAFDDFGIASPSDDQITRVAATLLPAWALDGATSGLPRLPVAEQRAILAIRLGIAESLAPERCETYLWDGADGARAIEMSALAAMPSDSATAFLGRLMAASMAEYGDDPPFVPLPPADEDQARRALGAAIMAKVDASPDPDRLIAALSPTAWGQPDQGCAARVLVLRAALDLPAPDGDLAVRLIAGYGMDGF
jgi:hypothetical protein